MLKKLFFLALALLLTTSTVFAQAAARNASPATIGHTKSDFTNIEITGVDTLGNPGYLAMAGVSTQSGYQTNYYLWIDETGNLCIASHATIKNYASFPDGNWRKPNMPACTVVGGQS